MVVGYIYSKMSQPLYELLDKCKETTNIEPIFSKILPKALRSAYVHEFKVRAQSRMIRRILFLARFSNCFAT